MMSFLESCDSSANDAAEAFGTVHDKHILPPALNRNNFPGLIAGQSLAVLLKPLTGLLNQTENDTS